MDITDAERAILEEIGLPPNEPHRKPPEGFEGHELPMPPRRTVFRPRWPMEAVYGAADIQSMIDRGLLATWLTWTPAETKINRDKEGRMTSLVRTARLKPFLTLTSLAAEILGVELADRGWRYRRPLGLKEPIRPTNQANAPLPLPLPNMVAAPKDREWYTDEIPTPKKLDRHAKLNHGQSGKPKKRKGGKKRRGKAA